MNISVSFSRRVLDSGAVHKAISARCEQSPHERGAVRESPPVFVCVRDNAVGVSHGADYLPVPEIPEEPKKEDFGCRPQRELCEPLIGFAKIRVIRVPKPWALHCAPWVD